MAKRKPPDNSVFGWLGRQIGHVKKAVKTDVKAKPAKPPKARPKVVYRDNTVQEAAHPTEPGVKLRRTVIDEVIVVDVNKRMK